MSLSTIRSAIITILEAVTGIGKVYDYERYAKSPDGFKLLFTSNDDKFHVWQLTRESTEEISEMHTTNIRRHTMVIRGYYALKDANATAKTFQDLIETICEDLRVDFQLGGIALQCLPPQVRIVEHVEFTGVLCHHAEIVLVCEEYITYTPV